MVKVGHRQYQPRWFYCNHVILLLYDVLHQIGITMTLPTSESPISGMIQFLPTIQNIVYGASTVVNQLRDNIGQIEASTIVILTPQSISESTNITKVLRALEGLKLTHLAISCQHVPIDIISETTEIIANIQPDVIIAIGGGSTIDLAKAVRTCLANNISSEREIVKLLQDSTDINIISIPQISVPTTLSGSEYTRSFSATDFSIPSKYSVTDSSLASRSIFYDPAFIVDTPRKLWMSSGFMALDHAIEVFVLSEPNIVGDLFKLEAVNTLLTWLPISLDSESDLQAKLHCQLAAWMADHSPIRSRPFSSNSHTLFSHGLAYELGAHFNIPYGLTACATLIPCLKFYEHELPTIKPRIQALDTLCQTNNGNNLYEALTEILDTNQISTRLSDLGVAKSDLPSLANAFRIRNSGSGGASQDIETMCLQILTDAW